jgi:hypothetical protein
MLNVVYAEYRKIGLYAKCHYAECRHADCRGARISAPPPAAWVNVKKQFELRCNKLARSAFLDFCTSLTFANYRWNLSLPEYKSFTWTLFWT